MMCTNVIEQFVLLIMLSSPLSRNLHCEYNAIIVSPENNAYVQVRGGKARIDRYLHIYTAALSGPRRAQCAPHLSAGQPVPPHPRHQPAHTPPGGQRVNINCYYCFI